MSGCSGFREDRAPRRFSIELFPNQFEVFGNPGLLLFLFSRSILAFLLGNIFSVGIVRGIKMRLRGEFQRSILRHLSTRIEAETLQVFSLRTHFTSYHELEPAAAKVVQQRCGIINGIIQEKQSCWMVITNVTWLLNSSPQMNPFRKYAWSVEHKNCLARSTSTQTSSHESPSNINEDLDWCDTIIFGLLTRGTRLCQAFETFETFLATVVYPRTRPHQLGTMKYQHQRQWTLWVPNVHSTLANLRRDDDEDIIQLKIT